MTKTTSTMTAEEIREMSRKVAICALERKGWDILAPNGWRDADIVAFDNEEEEMVLISLSANFKAERDDSLPPIDFDDVERERAKALLHAYVGEHPDTTAIRWDAVSMWIFNRQEGRLAHLIAGYTWREQA